MYVTFLLDVEDIVTPEADDFTRDVAMLLTSEGVVATFCVVGERARQGEARGRVDVIEALDRHDIGSHTDWHSVHPTVIEYLADRGWEQGVAEARRREAPAVEALRRIFGRDPSCWGGPGNTWGPQVTEALKTLAVPAVVYAHTRVPAGTVHRFLDVLAYPYCHAARDALYHDTAAAQQDRERLISDVLKSRDAGLVWVDVFLGHPSRMLHHEFWDAPNFVAGRNPQVTEWRSPQRKTVAEALCALESLRSLVQAIRAIPGIEVKSIREMNALVAGWREEALTRAEEAAIVPEIRRRVLSMSEWVILPPHMDTRPLWELTSQRLATLRRLRPC